MSHKLKFQEKLDQYKVEGIYNRINTLVTIHELFTDQKEDWFLDYQAPWMIVHLIFREELREFDNHPCYNHMRYVAERWGGAAFKDKEFTNEFVKTCESLVNKVNLELALAKEAQESFDQKIKDHILNETSLPLGFNKGKL